jgi:hypothetical protein
LLHYGEWFSEETMLEVFRHFDSLGNGAERLQLTKAFEEFLEKAPVHEESARIQQEWTYGAMYPSIHSLRVFDRQHDR